MSKKASVNPYMLFTNESMVTSLTSEWMDIRNSDNCAFQIVWTGSPVGVFGVQVSSDATNYTTISLSPSITASGSGDTAIIEMNQMGSNYIRLYYTRTSGTGAVTASITAKDL